LSLWILGETWLAINLSFKKKEKEKKKEGKKKLGYSSSLRS